DCHERKSSPDAAQSSVLRISDGSALECVLPQGSARAHYLARNLAGDPRQVGRQAKSAARANVNEEFPLRNFVVCGECGNPLTSCWSKGHGGRYPYYLSHKSGCGLKGKSIPRAEIEG